MSKTILRDTSYQKFDPFAGGGKKRTAQLDEIIKRGGFKIIDSPPSLGIDRIEKLTKNQLRSIRFINRVRGGIHLLKDSTFPMPLNWRAIERCGYLYQRYRRFLEKYQGNKVAIWETTRREHYLFPYAARDAGFKVIAVPHNLESLHLGHVDPFGGEELPKSFIKELSYFSLADRVFCISREEQWLLKLFGINADFLPYYPVDVVYEKLVLIREIRQSRGKEFPNRFLVLGSATNSVTKAGMLHLLSLLHQIQRNFEFKIDLAGFRTEQLQPQCDSYTWVQLHGTIDVETLEKLLSTTRAILIYQEAGVGALTRIPEMLIAGVPVIANSNACRSMFEYKGIFPYETVEELSQIMATPFETIPPIPRRHLNLEERFVSCLNDCTIESNF